MSMGRKDSLPISTNMSDSIATALASRGTCLSGQRYFVVFLTVG